MKYLLLVLLSLLACISPNLPNGSRVSCVDSSGRVDFEAGDGSVVELPVFPTKQYFKILRHETKSGLGRNYHLVDCTIVGPRFPEPAT